MVTFVVPFHKIKGHDFINFISFLSRQNLLPVQYLSRFHNITLTFHSLHVVLVTPNANASHESLLGILIGWSRAQRGQTGVRFERKR